MHKALLRLILLQTRAWLRRQFTGGSTRRLIFGIVGTVMFILWLTAVAMGSALQKARSFEEILSTLPLYLTGFVLLSLVMGSDDRAIAFTPAEIDILFPGPFSRRDIVLYKMLKQVIGSLFGGMIFGLMLRRFAIHLPAGIAGAALSLTFINILTTVVALARALVEERYYKLARAGALLLLAGGVIAAVAFVRSSDLPTADELRRLADTTPARVILAPALVFARVFAARSFPEFTLWAGGCLGLIALAGVGVLALDRGYMEAALAASQRRQARLARMGRGIAVNPGVKVRTLPSLTLLGAPGALIRRQAITAVRTSRAWIVVFLFAIGYGYFISRLTGDIKGNAGIASAAPGLMMLLVMLPQMLRFDFRGDLDHVDVLKALPLRPFSIALAELTVPTAILSLQGLVVVAGVAGFMHIPPAVAVMSALGVPPVAALLIGLENFAFLLLPTRMYAPGQAANVFSGRRIILMLGRLMLLTIGGGITAAVGAGAWALTHSPWATFAACWCTVGSIVAGVVLATAFAFARFDVSRDMPT